MVAPKLVQQIEDHWQAIATRTVRKVRNCSDLPHLREMPASDLELISQRTLQNLSGWLHNNPELEMGHRYQEVGRQRFRDGMLIHEAVRGIQLMKESTLDYIREQGFTSSSVEILAEEELEFRLGRFFDLLVFHLVKGYEEEMRREMTPKKTTAERIATANEALKI
jgi:hypothetical protein